MKRKGGGGEKEQYTRKYTITVTEAKIIKLVPSLNDI